MLILSQVNQLSVAASHSWEETHIFYFDKDEFVKAGGHAALLKAAEKHEVRGLAVDEGGFTVWGMNEITGSDWDARYSFSRHGLRLSSVWKNGCSSHFMRMLQVIFRIHDIATFKNGAEAANYILGLDKDVE